MNIESIQSNVVSARTGIDASGGVRAKSAGQSPSAANEVVKQSSSSSPNDRTALEHAVKRLSEFVSSNRPEMNFSVDETSGVQVVKIIDSQSKQVIRQIPSEEAIQIAQALDKLQGLFVKDKA